MPFIIIPILIGAFAGGATYFALNKTNKYVIPLTVIGTLGAAYYFGLIGKK